jgi:hypothetical protein
MIYKFREMRGQTVIVSKKENIVTQGMQVNGVKVGRETQVIRIRKVPYTRRAKGMNKRTVGEWIIVAYKKLNTRILGSGEISRKDRALAE